ncbi:urea ABC transporter permease subunit UrtB [Rhodosalinus sediminis]|uniref:urea ABC transporter permease subunit UrtB n=1 Tax=Rhodosalinus sediminis TaxID=1940533 RepID=UPI002355D256|nr:urea ABC transporter permease subunit UrtB [Rhodosalinus sediminis]
MLLRFLRSLLLVLLAVPTAGAAETLQDILQRHADEVADPGRRTVGPVIEDLVASGLPGVPSFLTAWSAREVVQRPGDGLFFVAEETGDDRLTLRDVATGEALATDVPEDTVEEVRPNGGVRRVIGTALVQFQLADPDPEVRRDAVQALSRSLEPDQIAPLERSIPGESDPALKARKEQLLAYLQARYGATTEARVAALDSLAGDLSVETRAVLNQVLDTEFRIAETPPEGPRVARVLTPGEDISREEAHAALVEAGRAAAGPTPGEVKAALEANIAGGRVGGVPVAQLSREAARARAYAALAEAGTVPPLVSPAQIEAALERHSFFEEYTETDAEVIAAAARALASTEVNVGLNQGLDLGLDALSLASIYFLAAIGLAITFGVMGVINMAHGEFIMMGAYTGYVVQLVIPDYTLSLIVALPLAFAVTFGAGVALERLVIRWLYHRPLETLLATFGVSIMLQQLAKNIFGTQARPLTAPGWLDGSLVVNDIVSISYIRIAIFVMALIFLAVLLVVLNRTRLGLEVRAVTQNPGMAASMGIDPDRINMLTFGLGSGIAGIAGVAIGLYAKVTSEMGQDYIVQSFMTVVVGGVGNVWGTLAGAGLIGIFQKSVEWLNPSNTLAAQTYMVLFIVLFIQIRPRGIVALRGRAAEA